MMTVPPLLSQLLMKSEHHPHVWELVKSVSHILNDNKMPFFPAFTDHGIQHIEEVLRSAVELVPQGPDNPPLLTPNDAAVLVCATLLHDIAMHLREDGFVELVRGSSPHAPVPWFTRTQGNCHVDHDWKSEWDIFLAEVRQLGDKQLHAIFGDAEGSHHNRTLSLRPQEWNDYDRLLIGEFIRRHHTRLAHEIALYGFPGLNARHFPILAHSMPFLADVIGVVARSHGMPMRMAADYLSETHPGVVLPAGCSAVYLMALLRIADDLQLTSHRAPPILLHLRNPHTQLSVDEWNKHGAIDYVAFAHKDPQAIYIHSNTSHSLRTHLQVRELIEGLQHELDHSAAVISEVYGRVHEDALFRTRLSKSRIRTNINDTAYLRRLPYVPRYAGFAVDSGMLALIVQPLYGDVVEIAVRELLQNSLDAVRERIFYCNKYPDSMRHMHFRENDTDVTVSLTNAAGKWTLSITDTGIGMTEHTVLQYFLRAGASFRNSRAWLDTFSDHTQPAVFRSGRFGIGIFAAFLVGRKISVETRHASEESGAGLAFQAGMDSTLIEIARRPMPHGTKIEIDLHPSKAERLYDSATLDWYTLRHPSIRIRMQKDGSPTRDVPQQYMAPSPEHANESRRGWSCITPEGFGPVYWTYRKYPPITCNGVRIARVTGAGDFEDARYAWEHPDRIMRFPEPRLSIFDPECRLPLTLTRDRLIADRVPFESELMDDIALDVIGFALAQAPTAPYWESGTEAKAEIWFRKYMPFLERDYGVGFFSWCCDSRGVALLDRDLVSLCQYERVLISGAVGLRPELWVLQEQLSSRYLAIALSLLTDDKYVSHSARVDDIPRFLEYLVSLGSQGVERPWGRVRGAQLTCAQPPGRMARDWFAHWRNLNGPEVIARGSRDIYQMRMGTFTPGDIETELIARACSAGASGAVLPFVLEIEIERDSGYRARKSVFGSKWREHIGDEVIPFDRGRREQMLNRTLRCEALRAHYESWLK